MAKGDDAFFRLLVEGIPEALIVSKPDGTITYFNPAAERLTGYVAADVEGQDISILLPRRDDRRADPLKWLQRWAAEPDDVQSRFLDLIGRTKQGKDLPFGVRVRPQTIGGEALFLITFRDVSIRKAEQASFRESHLRATRILQIAEDAIVSIDQNQEITFFNLKAEQVFGYAAEDVIGKPMTMLLPDSLRRTHGAHVRAFGESKVPSKLMSQRGEVSGLRKNGEIFPIEASITSVHVHGTPTFTAHIRDITAQKAAQSALVESELRFRAIFDNAYEAIALLTQGGKVLEINRAAKALTEGDAPLTGMALWDLPWFTDETDQEGEREGREQLRQAVAAGAEGKISHFETGVTKPGGEARRIDFNLIPVKDANSEIVFLVAEGRDITSRT